jgi:O-antigen ligase
MNIFILIGIIILLYAFWNFKKAFFVFLVFQLFLVQNINLINRPGIPLLTLEMFMTVMFLVLYYFKRKTINKETIAFPLKTSFVVIVISYFASSVFSIAGIGNTVSVFVGHTLALVWVYLMWLLVKDKADIVFLIKALTIAFIAIGIYGIYEHIVSINPLAEYEITLAGDVQEKILDWDYSDDINRGYRIKSVFAHAIGAGVNWAMYMLFTLYLMLYYPRFHNKNTFVLIVAIILSLFCLFFTASRTPIVFFLVGALALLNFRKKRAWWLFVGAGIVIGVFFEYLAPYVDNIASLYSTSAAEKVGGSNLEMRVGQLDAAYTLFKESPAFGLGLKATNFHHNRILISRLLGVESVWFRILVERGLLGVISYVYLMYSLLVVIPKQYKTKLILFFSLAYFITNTVSSTPGMLDSLFYLFLIMIMKIQMLTKPLNLGNIKTIKYKL